MSEGVHETGRTWTRAVAPLYLWLAVPGLLSALPAGLLVGRLWGQRPGGDRLLWEAGGFGLVETARLLGRDVGAVGWALPWLMFGWSLLGVVPEGLALASLRPGETGASRWARALGSIPALVMVLGGTLLARLAALALGVAALSAFAPATGGLGDRERDLVRLGVALVGSGLFVLVRLWHDVAAVAVVDQGRRGVDALVTGLEVLHRRLVAATLAWGWRAALGALAVALAVVAGRGLSGAGLVLTVLAHQGALLALAALRASWFDWARRSLPALALADADDTAEPPDPAAAPAEVALAAPVEVTPGDAG